MGNVVKASSKQFWVHRSFSEFNEDIIENYNEESDKAYFL